VADRAATWIGQGGGLFAYGTLRFPQTLRALLCRVPSTSEAIVTGWRAAALAGRSYPGLVSADSQVAGVVLDGLTAEEICVIDDYESDPYGLRRVCVNDGRTVWAYVWTDAASVLASDWSATRFAREHLGAFALECHRWRDAYRHRDGGAPANLQAYPPKRALGRSRAAPARLPRPRRCR
jgi:gamma-glutamylcyclotransferase (GGCT)/AIG2-like uncharacterized protein YtfP